MLQLSDILRVNDNVELTLDNASLYRESNKMQLALSSPSLLTDDEISTVRDGFFAVFPECEIKLCIAYPNIDAELAADFSAAYAKIQSVLCKRYPALSVIFQNSNVKFDGSTLTFTTPKVSASKQAQELLSDYFTNELGAKCRLFVVLDDDVKLPEVEMKAKLPTPAPKPVPKAKPSSAAKSTSCGSVLYGKPIKNADIFPISDIAPEQDNITICGSVFGAEVIPLKNKPQKAIFKFSITDNTSSVSCKLFMKIETAEELSGAFKTASGANLNLKIQGSTSLDSFTNETMLNPTSIETAEKLLRTDTAENKRVELHLHTKFSQMDAVTDVDEVIKTAARWGHKSIAITDHGVVHSFPFAYKAAKKANIQLVYGVEGYVYPDCRLIPMNSNDEHFVFLEAVLYKKLVEPQVYELYACRFTENGPTELRIFVNPGMAIPHELKPLLPEDATEHALPLSDAIKELQAFVGDDSIVAFSPDALSALCTYSKRIGTSMNREHIDVSLLLGYLFRKELKEVTLKSATSLLLNEELQDAADTRTKAQYIHRLFDICRNKIFDLDENCIPLMTRLPGDKEKGRGHNSNHIILLAKNHDGLVNMYKLVSYSHTEHFKTRPRIPKSLLLMHKRGLIIGSACEQGEIFRAVLENKSESEIDELARLYDYMEIQPIANNEFLVRNGTVANDEGLIKLNKRILAIGDRLNKPTVATCDAHFLNSEDGIFRKILLHAQKFEDYDKQAPLYMRTTDEMLEEFSYLGERAEEVVVTNPNAIAEACEMMPPFLSEKSTYAPTIKGANEELEQMSMNRAHELYGEVLPPEVDARLKKELHSIISNDYSSLYLFAQRLVRKSMSDGYLVGSRGSVGSSFVACMAGITEVNPLPAHYLCPNCKHSEFTNKNCGVDMEDKNCPVCGTLYNKTGFDIPFEVFLGFKGDKTPDIDLNFSGDYQPVAHKYVEEMVGEGHAFRSGTIGTLKDKTIYGYVKKYSEDTGKSLRAAEMERLVNGCIGVKRTTGQHPGGIIVVPDGYEITDFCPIQFPADKLGEASYTTHFDFHALDDRLVKLDILGHDDPTMLRMLKDISGLDPITVPLDDPETMKLFSSSESLGVDLSEINTKVGTLAIPEFGTGFVRGMLLDTMPTTYEELLRISGLSHGTNVWLGNAQELIRSKTATLSEVICTRDDIMNYLISKGCEASTSFKIMESVRKGRGLTPEMEEFMQENHIESWFVDSCKKIAYLFPRAHAVAYVTMAFRVAYYKVHHPLAFYASYFTVRADDFDITCSVGGKNAVAKNLAALDAQIHDLENTNSTAVNKQKNVYAILEVVYEMNARGLELLPLSLEKSDSHKFLIEGNSLRPPFSSIPGLGLSVSEAIVQARDEAHFASREDLVKRGKVNSANMTMLDELGALKDLPDSDQISLLDLL